VRRLGKVLMFSYTGLLISVCVFLDGAALYLLALDTSYTFMLYRSLSLSSSSLLWSLFGSFVAHRSTEPFFVQCAFLGVLWYFHFEKILTTSLYAKFQLPHKDA